MPRAFLIKPDLLENRRKKKNFRDLSIVEKMLISRNLFEMVRKFRAQENIPVSKELFPFIEIS